MKYLSPLAEIEIDALKAEGVDLSPTDIVRINALAWRVETPQARLTLSRGTPVSIGGVSLWPMTLHGSDWFQRVGANVGNDKHQMFALAYAMANGRDDLPEDIKDARRIVGKWGRALRCRYTELEESIRQVHEQFDMIETGETGPSASAGDISMMLSAMTNTEPEVWERRCSVPYVLEMLDRMVAQNAAEGESSKHDPRIKAERALGLFINQLKKRDKRISDDG